MTRSNQCISLFPRCPSYGAKSRDAFLAEMIEDLVVMGRSGNSCRWIVFVSCQCTDRINIRQPKVDMDNKLVNIR